MHPRRMRPEHLRVLLSTNTALLIMNGTQADFAHTRLRKVMGLTFLLWLDRPWQATRR
jgi:hypothetical protein